MLRSESKVFKRSNFLSKKFDPKGETRKQKELKIFLKPLRRMKNQGTEKSPQKPVSPRRRKEVHA